MSPVQSKMFTRKRYLLFFFFYPTPMANPLLYLPKRFLAIGIIATIHTHPISFNYSVIEDTAYLSRDMRPTVLTSCSIPVLGPVRHR